VGWFSSFGCHLDFNDFQCSGFPTKKQTLLRAGFFTFASQFFSLPQAGFFPKKRVKKMRISDLRIGVFRAKKIPSQEASKKITCDLQKDHL
jgi:hypothetical protein